MRSNVVVGTHHKTGTVWMSSVFNAIATRLGVRYIDFWANGGDVDWRSGERFILFNYHSIFRTNAEMLDADNVRILHLVRDPRDVLISALKFHLRSDEKWLLEPSADFGGKSYQQVLKDLPSKYDQYVFEMEHSSRNTLGQMERWDYGRSNCFEARYGELISDVDLQLWEEIISFLGFEDHEREVCRECFWRFSLFGDLAGSDHVHVKSHVQSGREGQWRTEFDATIAQAFVARFPTVLQTLKYEPDGAWVEALDATAPRGELPPLHVHHAKLKADRRVLLACYGTAFGDKPEERLEEIRERKSLQAQIIASRMNVQSTDVVMDFGAGCGFMARAMAPIAAAVYCIDVEPEFGEFAREELAACDNVHCLTVDRLDLSPVADIQFTKIYFVSVAVLFNYYDLHSHIELLSGVLAPGGEIYFDYADPVGIADGDGAIFSAHRSAFRVSPRSIQDLVQYNGLSAVKAALEANGLELVESWQVHAETFSVLARKPADACATTLDGAQADVADPDSVEPTSDHVARQEVQ